MNVHRDTTADLILTNATVITIDADRPRAQAVAVRGENILAVGSTHDLKAFIGPRTSVIDLEGRTVVPGFNDAHNHMAGYGLELNMVSLHPRNVASIQEIVNALRERAGAVGKGSWILGAGYDDNKLPESTCLET